MEKNEIEDYIKKLTELNDIISNVNDESILIDDNFVDELSKVMSSITKDVEKEMVKSSTNDVEVKIKKLRENAVIPKYSKDGYAGMDLTITHIISETDENINYGYGLAFEIPDGYVGIVISDITTIIKNNIELQITSFNKIMRVGDVFGKLIILPIINFKLIT